MSSIINAHIIAHASPSIYGAGSFFQIVLMLIYVSILLYSTMMLAHSIKQGIRSNILHFSFFALLSSAFFIRSLLLVVPLPYSLIWYYLLCVYLPDSLESCGWLVYLWWVRSQTTPNKSTPARLLVFHVIVFPCFVFYQVIAFLVSLLTSGSNNENQREPVATSIFKAIEAVIMISLVLTSFIALIRQLRSKRKPQLKKMLLSVIIPTGIYLTLLFLTFLFEILDASMSYWLMNLIGSTLTICETKVLQNHSKQSCVGFSALHFLFTIRSTILPLTLLLISYTLTKKELRKTVSAKYATSAAFENAAGTSEGTVTNEYKDILAAGASDKPLLEPTSHTSSLSSEEANSGNKRGRNKGFSGAGSDGQNDEPREEDNGSLILGDKSDDDLDWEVGDEFDDYDGLADFD
ncbi:hypothetical protein BLNAU_5377 [Blattamonas nauphoetae]|uniref:Uncharacterized protein n=1 Tax=Blattamonas nauphoetae TaxID=2049346 RepID=A0ABQ9Y7D4_9EUKA|nr:hypothetical protein BLNAU_5377 [Blattamonas nauphoetae]